MWQRLSKELCIGKRPAVFKGDFQFGVLAVELMLQSVEVAPALPLAHGQVMEKVVAAGLRLRGGHAFLCENPLKALDGESTHILDGV